jgi:diguanylate cyclase (GGDEF)-like protein
MRALPSHSLQVLVRSAFSRNVSYFLPAGALLIVGSLIAVAATIWHLRTDALAEALRENANLALVLGQQTERAIEAIDLVVQATEDEIVGMNIETPQQLEAALGTEAVNQALANKINRLPQAAALAVASARGLIINSSRTWPIPIANVRDRDYFKHFSTSDDRGAFISAPVTDRMVGAGMTVYLVRRVNGRDGHFLGLVLGAVQLKYFEDIYSAINLPRKETFLLARTDGMVLVRHPDPQHRSGYVIPPDSPWHRAVLDGGGYYVSPGNLDGTSRLVSLQPLKNYGLVVSVGVTKSAALSAWMRQAAFIGTATLLLLAYATYLMRMVRRQFRRLRESEASLGAHNLELTRLSSELRDSQDQLQAKSSELKTTLDTMDQGLMMIDKKGMIIVCNRRATQLLDIPVEFNEAPRPFTELLAYQWYVNKTGSDAETFEEYVRTRTVFNRSHTHELRRPNGTILESRTVPLADGGVVRTYTDITERTAAEERTRHAALHDGLTQLMNRTAFSERLQEEMMRAAIDQVQLALFYLDLDHFKNVNDGRGHDVGDRLLSEAAQRMRNVIRSGDTVARLGGDEFAVLIPNLDNLETLEVLAQRFIASLEKPFIIDGEASRVGASIGIALYPDHSATIDDLLRHADEALYEAKRAGRNTYRISRARADVRVA